MDSCWYYYLFREQFGPVTRQQLVEMVDDGTLAASDKVRHVSGDMQQEVASVLGLDAASRVPARSTAPVATPLSLMAEGKSGNMRAQSESVVEIAGGLSIDDFVIEKTSDDSSVKEAPPAARPAPSESVQDHFYLRSSETTIGPLSLDALCRMADAGKVASADYIRRDGESGWQPANEVPEVMASVLMQEAARPKKKVRRSGDSQVNRQKGSGGSGVRPRAGRNGKKKPRSRDEKLQGIFDEVFRSDEGDRQPTPVADRASVVTGPVSGTATPSQTPPEEPSVAPPNVTAATAPPSPQAPAAAAANPAAAATAAYGGVSDNGMAAQVPPATGQMPASASMNAGTTPAAPPAAGGLYGHQTGMGGMNGMAGTASQPVKPWVPPKKKKKSGGGMDPDTLRNLGIGGGIIAALVLIPVLWFMLPGGNYAPDSATVKTELLDMVGRYETASASAGPWQAFQEEVRPTAGGWVKQYRAAGQRTPEQLKLQEAATQLVQLVNSKFDDKEKHQKFLDKINEQLGAASG